MSRSSGGEVGWKLMPPRGPLCHGKCTAKLTGGGGKGGVGVDKYILYFSSMFSKYIDLLLLLFQLSICLRFDVQFFFASRILLMLTLVFVVFILR